LLKAIGEETVCVEDLAEDDRGGMFGNAADQLALENPA